MHDVERKNARKGEKCVWWVASSAGSLIFFDDFIYPFVVETQQREHACHKSLFINLVINDEIWA